MGSSTFLIFTNRGWEMSSTLMFPFKVNLKCLQPSPCIVDVYIFWNICYISYGFYQYIVHNYNDCSLMVPAKCHLKHVNFEMIYDDFARKNGLLTHYPIFSHFWFKFHLLVILHDLTIILITFSAKFTIQDHYTTCRLLKKIRFWDDRHCTRGRVMLMSCQPVLIFVIDFEHFPKHVIIPRNI